MFEPGSRIEKPWGYEILLAVNEHYAMKEIFLRSGTRSSLQSHTRKTESIVVVDGALELELEDEQGVVQRSIVETGGVYDVLPNRRHRVTATVDTKVIEVSTPEQLDDVIRHEDDFGRA